MSLRAICGATKLLRNLKLTESFVPNVQSQRGVKALVDIKWIRPVRPPCNASGPDASGDLVTLTHPPPITPSLFYKDAPSLNEANDAVKTIFSINNQGSYFTRKAIIEEYLNRVKGHRYDTKSPEARIAIMTAKIRYNQDYLAWNPANKFMKHRCKELIEKRRRALKILRKMDYKRFEWVLEKLDLVFKAFAEDRTEPVTRKKAVIKLLNMRCKEIKDKKLQAYKKSLIEKKEKVLKEFAANPV